MHTGNIGSKNCRKKSFNFLTPPPKKKLSCKIANNILLWNFSDSWTICSLNDILSVTERSNKWEKRLIPHFSVKSYGKEMVHHFQLQRKYNTMYV